MTVVSLTGEQRERYGRFSGQSDARGTGRDTMIHSLMDSPDGPL